MAVVTIPTHVGSGAVDPVPAGDRCPTCHAPVSGSWLTCSGCGARLAVSAELASGIQLHGDRFVIDRLLGRGGFGITYAAQDARLRRQVALKELFPDTAVRHGMMVLSPPESREPFAQARDRFLREARVLARFSHPGIVRVYEVFEEHGTAYLVLELLDGRSLAQILREQGRPFGEAAALDVASRVGAALAAIHAAGLLHRDVSPSNLVLTGSGRIVLIDFGLARSFDSEQTAAMTRIVTPGYAPPEQYLASARFGPPTDVYGLAATLYRLLTATTLPSAIERQNGTELPAVRVLNPAVSKMVSDAILDGLELNPDHRPTSIEGFVARLGVTLDTPVWSGPASAGGSTPGAPTAPTVGDSRAVTSAGAGAGPTRPPTAPTVVGGTLAAASAASGPAVGVGGTPAAGPARRYLVPAPVATRVAPIAPPPAVEPRPAAPALSPVAAALSPVAPAAWGEPERPDAASYLPRPVIGPPRKGRWVVSLPLTLALVVLTSAAPVLMTVVSALVILPLLATDGDLALHRHRRTWGGAANWFQRRGELFAAAPRFVRNVVVSFVRALPTLILLGVLVACWYQIHSHARLAQTAMWFLRLSGVAVGLLLVVPAMRGSRRFNTGVAIDAIHLRLAPSGSRLIATGWLLWLVAILLIAAGAAFSPDVWPLHP